MYFAGRQGSLVDMLMVEQVVVTQAADLKGIIIKRRHSSLHIKSYKNN